MCSSVVISRFVCCCGAGDTEGMCSTGGMASASSASKSSSVMYDDED